MPDLVHLFFVTCERGSTFVGNMALVGVFERVQLITFHLSTNSKKFDRNCDYQQHSHYQVLDFLISNFLNHPSINSNRTATELAARSLKR